MEELIILLGWVGVYGVMAISAIGSIIGCAVAGQAAIGALMEVEGGYGKYIGLGHALDPDHLRNRGHVFAEPDGHGG